MREREQQRVRIGILGGSGLYDMKGLRDAVRRRVRTPFGDPSDEFVCGRFSGVEVCFLPRHGVGHSILPSEINYRANIMGFKMLGCQQVVSVSAVGSLKHALRPRDIVLPDQYFDRTKNAQGQTFFGGGVVAHVGFGHPACEALRGEVAAAVRAVLRRRPARGRPRLHVGGTYVNMEGPAFSTLAESRYYRSLGFDVIGMTSLAEAKLCREAEICYQAMAVVTDYDCWHETAGHVTVEMIVGHLRANAELAMEALADLVPRIRPERRCACVNALQYGLTTDRRVMPAAAVRKLKPILGKYLR